MTNKGFSLIEIVLVVVILFALSALAIPSAEITQVRLREKLLRERLREIRQAIDIYQASRIVSGGNILPICIASLTEEIPEALLKPGANSGPFLLKESMGNPFTSSQEEFFWDVRDSTGTWHQNQKDSNAQLYCYDIRYPKDGISGWIKAIDESFYENW